MALPSVSLDDKFAASEGRIYLTGIQALVRTLLSQARRDRGAGLDTRGFVSGYRGSPLGGLDQQLWRAQPHLDAAGVHFEPGLNEELAATAVAGSQQLAALPGAACAGVYGVWYGKAPGVDRAGDALRHGNAAGSSPLGGVLVVAGDDHACKSSTLPSQSELALADFAIPVLNPAGVQEVLRYGLLGLALSRFAGCYAGLIALADTMDSSATIDADDQTLRIALPESFARPADGLHFLPGRSPLEQEERMLHHRLEAALAFARANRIDRTLRDDPGARVGIVTTGKATLDVLQALDDLGLDAGAAALRVYKVGMPWPLEPRGLRRFADGLEEILVVEEKRGVVEQQLKQVLFDAGLRPRVVGKHDETGRPLLSALGDLSPARVARALAKRLPDAARTQRVRDRLAQIEASDAVLERAGGLRDRTPFFCSGCPHNLSTRVPEGSHAVAGIGCHYMARWMDRRTDVVAQMGGEGAHWIGQTPFTETRHLFVNLGDGTYFHSGLLAVRAAISAGVNVTYKILVNDAVAMTGGQKLDGTLSVPRLTRQLAAEGVGRIAVVGEDLDRWPDDDVYAAGVSLHPRAELMALQSELRETPGCSVLVYDQVCAAELRRRRKRGLAEEPERRVFIHEEVCEGCGDCSEQSSCISIQPLETEFGRKRVIDQSSCNKDYACLSGLCPALVTVRGGALRRASIDPAIGTDGAVPEPERLLLDGPWNAVVAGIGGTGVVTVGALLGMAAHLEGRGATVLDMTGLAQKGGAVLSHIRIAATPDRLHTPRVPNGCADLLLACDLVAAGSREAASKLGRGRTHAVVDTHVVPTADFVLDNSVEYEASTFLSLLHENSRAIDALDATRLARRLLGDTIGANLFLLGYALQKGSLPVGREALERAVELNGVAVEANLRALAWGRLAALDRTSVERAGPRPEAPRARGLEERIAMRETHLVAYQGTGFARRFRERVEAVRAREAQIAPGQTALTEAVARGYHRLLAPKDEYEVARLMTGEAFRERLAETFDGDFAVELHLAPPLFARLEAATGRPRKRRYGAWVFGVLRLLARARRLRGTWLDPFRYTGERRLERELRSRYERLLDTLIEGLGPENLELAARIASVSEQVRGFGVVKERAAARAREEEQKLLDAFLKRDVR